MKPITDEMVSKFIVFAREENGVLELEGCLLQLQALRTRLPRSADGYPIIPGLRVYHGSSEWFVRSISFNPAIGGDKMLLHLLQHDPAGECTARAFQVFCNPSAAREAGRETK